MGKKILVAYGTAAGSTGEVAEAIGEEFQKQGAAVDVKPVEDVKKADGYDAIVVGSAVRAFHLLRSTRKFLRRNKAFLQKSKVAYFVVCLTMKEETPETIQKAKDFAKPMLSVKEPVSLGLFGGCMDPEKLTGLMAMPFKNVPKEDNRDWEKIRAWANEVYPGLIKD